MCGNVWLEWERGAGKEEEEPKVKANSGLSNSTSVPLPLSLGFWSGLRVLWAPVDGKDGVSTKEELSEFGIDCGFLSPWLGLAATPLLQAPGMLSDKY